MKKSPEGAEKKEGIDMDLNSLNETLDQILQVLGSGEDIVYILQSILAILGTLFAAAGVAVTTTVVIITAVGTFVLSVLDYFMLSLGFYKLVKKTGEKNAWMAWIPFARFYRMFTLPKGTFKLLFFKPMKNRVAPFIIWLCVNYFSAMVVSLLETLLVALAAVPIIGWIISLCGELIVALIPVILLVVRIALAYGMYKDVFDIYLGKGEGTGAAVGCVIASLISWQIVTAIICLVISAKTPVKERVIEA